MQPSSSSSSSSLGWSAEQEKTLLEPYQYISANPGKEVRTKLIDAFNKWLQVPEEDLKVVVTVVRMLHNASLLLDDVEDYSELRRGLPVAHVIYGTPTTINSANYVYFLAMQELYKLKPETGSGKGKGKEVDCMALVIEELLNLHRGQGMDIFWRDSLTCPTEEEYLQMVLGKTGGLFRIAVKLMMARSASDADYVPLVNKVSQLFQIRDDLLNLQSTEYNATKGMEYEDITEGKFSFPIVHGIRADASNRQILNVLQKRTKSMALKQHIVNYLRDQTKSFEYTRSILRQLDEEIMAMIDDLGGNEELKRIIEALAIKQPTGQVTPQ